MRLAGESAQGLLLSGSLTHPKERTRPLALSQMRNRNGRSVLIRRDLPVRDAGTSPNTTATAAAASVSFSPTHTQHPMHSYTA